MKDAENNDKRYKAELRDVSPLLVFFLFSFCVIPGCILSVCEKERDIGDR